MAATEGRVFHARMEHSGGVYRAMYRGVTNPNDPASGPLAEGGNILPDSHIGTDAASVKMFVEELARGQGYDHVEWDELPPELVR